MKHFESNVNDGMSRTDSIETLIDLTSCIAVNALMVAGGEANEKDAGAWWAMIALAEAALESYPEDVPPRATRSPTRTPTGSLWSRRSAKRPSRPPSTS